ncbi:MAG: hypothetical protein J6T67_10945 [Paludibacteraceae bacterium]|nr:hypothetical protein [Paludibacteraceae bacterium]
MMERIWLSEDEKKVLRLVNGGKKRPRGYSSSIYVKALTTLEEKKLVKANWAETEDEPLDVRMTPKGDDYLSSNPSLRNPINWVAVSAIAAILAFVVALIALFVACGRSIN